MALNINGTTGISGVDGSASAPAVTGTDSNTGINFGTDTVNINTGGSTRATVDSNGRFGVGVTSPLAPFHAKDATNNTIARFESGDATSRLQLKDNSGEAFVAATGDDLIFSITSSVTERMRLTAQGVDVSGAGIFHSVGVNPALDIEQQTDGNYTAIKIRNFYTGAAKNMMAFLDNNGNVRGSIVINNTVTTYNTTSDYRVKENVISLTDGITRLKKLKPYRFNFIGDSPNTVDGFFAHEAATVVPEAVTGTKDAVVTQAMIDAGEYNSDKLDQEIHQGIDQGKLVPLLTAALQEAVAKIEVLETKVAALEAA